MAKHVENIINVFKDEGSIPSGSTILNAYCIQSFTIAFKTMFEYSPHRLLFKPQIEETDVRAKRLLQNRLSKLEGKTL